MKTPGVPLLCLRFINHAKFNHMGIAHFCCIYNRLCCYHVCMLILSSYSILSKQSWFNIQLITHFNTYVQYVTHINAYPHWYFLPMYLSSLSTFPTRRCFLPPSVSFKSVGEGLNFLIIERWEKSCSSFCSRSFRCCNFVRIVSFCLFSFLFFFLSSK